MSFLNIMLLVFFFRNSMAKNNATEKQIEAEIIKRHQSYASMKTDRRENAKFIVTYYKDRFTS